MEEASSNGAYHDDERRDLEGLLEAFGTVFSLDDITSVYCQANRNVDMAGEILYIRGCTSTAGSHASKEEVEVVSASSLELSSVKEDASSTISGVSSDNLLQKSNNERISRVSKAKKCSTSMGTVSSVIGKDYVRSTPQTYESSEATKPLKLDSKEFPTSEIWSEEVPPSVTAGNDVMHKDVEAFIFQMLGTGFELDTNVIQEVLGLCGYDIEKSVEKLLDLSASTLGMNDDGLAAENPTGKCPDQEYLLCRRNVQISESNKRCGNGTGLMVRNEIGSPNIEGSKYNVQKGILESLFTTPERSEEKPRRRSPVRAVRRPRIFGKVVVEPFGDTDITIKRRTSTASMPDAEDDNEDDEFSYEVERKAVKEHWITMKEYYKSAVEAFNKGDRDRANKLLEKGQFFNTKAREADEKSVQKLFKTRDEDWYLDLRYHEPKEAWRLLKIHLNSISGIPSYQYLKVIVGTSEEDPKRTLKRRIIKGLEKESIKWTEEENGSKMSIRLDETNRRSSSFSKRQ